ncbi:hypothetical protein GWK47_026371 [Chionoecetes opilio]|uniref:CUB domain-containing protein n=1 Tax=Chionoecetes opilio TaxID=41210 RepID=A0A8J8WNI8_CHIOP|nr:hypothetical protein GWK47_026371 [Chionoecetes opilio]
MIRQVHHSPPLCLLTVVVVVVVLQPRLASTESLLQSLTQEELVLSVIANQMAILRGMNESSSVCTSGGGDLSMQQLVMTKIQVLEERVNEQVMHMNEQGMNKMQALEERVNEQVMNMNEQGMNMNEQGMNMNEQVMDKMQALEERVDEQVMSKTAELEEKMALMVQEQEEVAKNAVRRYFADQEALQALLHKDLGVSSCNNHKVLHGGKGILKRSGAVTSNQQCSWDVTLPEGSHPVFSWSAFIMTCRRCVCGSVTLWVEDVAVAGPFCGDSTQNMSQTPVKGNKFRVEYKNGPTQVNSPSPIKRPSTFTLSFHAVIST